jgi:UDP-N-acetylglucosamine 2-epimerase (non-hydrolysing)/GDP/UDP-N,N'-diacetylbacillosamine 2-epimerase (hydrolysing)
MARPQAGGCGEAKEGEGDETMRIAIVTGSRADRGALEMVDKALGGMRGGCHWISVDPEDLGDDGRPYEVLSPEDAVTGATVAACHIASELAEQFSDKEMVILHGDRYEILGAAMGANIMGIPIAHIGGGDITEGSQDDCFRHAVTKLSHLHFPTNQDAADRIIQMGEQPDRVHVVGDSGIDRVMQTPLLGHDETFAAVGLATPVRILLVSFHSNTLSDIGPELDALATALRARPAGTAMVLIGPNADAGNDMIRAEWQSLAGTQLDVVYHEDLPAQVYLSLMRWCDVMVGNSSAGLIEAPLFKLPFVNIGDRQRGRPQCSPIVNCEPVAGQIIECIERCLDVGKPKHPSMNLYGDGHAAERIAKIIGGIEDPKALLRKRFQSCRGMKACLIDR